jgi:hypothetical protein
MRETIAERDRIYDDANVRARIEDFLGADLIGSLECHHLIKGNETEVHFRQPHSPEDLYSFFEEGAEIFRSLWDRSSLIADLDIEYVNFDHPEKAYFEPESIFSLQEPVESAIVDVLSQYGIGPLHILSGRGHHFVWRIPQHSVAFERLVKVGRGPRSLWRISEKPHPPDGASVSLELAKAFAGLGLVMEFLAHRIQEIASPRCVIPVELTAIEVGPRNCDREMVSIDISEYGDPLHSRIVRAPLSVYLKPWQQSDPAASEFKGTAYPHPLFAIPLDGINASEGIGVMRNPKKVSKLARRASTKIPDAAGGTARLIADYAKSKLAKFHEWFYSREPERRERWPETYDRAPVELLSACTRLTLEQPNDLLLRPSCIRRLVRSLLALGWHPRDIAGLICSKYERDFGWTQFSDVDPSTRADFYTRIFAGLFVTGRDDLVDFNCCSAQEQGLCFSSNCNDNLLRFKQSAVNRRAHDKLAHWPFNRLLLSPEHS